VFDVTTDCIDWENTTCISFNIAFLTFSVTDVFDVTTELTNWQYTILIYCILIYCTREHCSRVFMHFYCTIRFLCFLIIVSEFGSFLNSSCILCTVCTVCIFSFVLDYMVEVLVLVLCCIIWPISALDTGSLLSKVDIPSEVLGEDLVMYLSIRIGLNRIRCKSD